jgi:hypothetical protein
VKRFDVEKVLGEAHKALATASFLIVSCLVKRKVSRLYLEAAREQVNLCSAALDKVLERINREK